MKRAAGVRQFAIVRDAFHACLIKPCKRDESMRLLGLTEGVALLAGAWRGGEKGVLPPRKGSLLISPFRAALLGPNAAQQ